MPNDSTAQATDPMASPANATVTEPATPAAAPAAAPVTSVTDPATAAPTPQGAPAAAEPGAKPDDKPQGAPEQYAEFSAPEGVVLDEAVVTDFKSVAKDLGMSQENAQKVIDKLGPTIARQQTEAITQAAAQASAEWAQQAAADAELIKGASADTKANFEQNIAVAKTAWETYGTPELQKLLNDSGLGNHPEMIRWAYRVGQTLKQDNQHVSGGNPGGAKDARSLYPNSNLAP